MEPHHLTSDARGGQPDPAGARERAAGVILYRRAADGTPRFLILETRKGGHYSPPKGHLDPGESFEEAAARETLEEAGLAPRALDPGFRVRIEYEVEKKGRPHRKEVVYFLGEAAAEGEVRLSDEHVAARWATLEEVERAIPFENLVDVYRQAAERLAARRGGP